MSEVIAGPLAAAAALLVVAGVEKVRSPQATVDAVRALGPQVRPVLARLLGVTEVLAGAGCLVAPSVLAFDAALTVLYVVFAGFVALLLLRGVTDVSCGCLGAEEARPSRLHLAVNLACAGIGGLALTAGPQDVVSVLDSVPLAGVPFVIATATVAYLAYHALSALPNALNAYEPPLRGE